MVTTYHVAENLIGIVTIMGSVTAMDKGDKP